MRIAESEISFAAAHQAQASVERRLQITVVAPSPVLPDDSLNLSEAGVAAAADAGDEESLPPMLALLKRLIEEMLGHEIRLGRRLPSPQPSEPRHAVTLPASAAATATEVQYSEHREESEHLRVAAEGWVQTRDGRRIAFQLELALDRRFTADLDLDIRSGELVRRKKDPLVINFDSTAAQLGNARFDFDLDVDGTADSVSTLGGGSAFLALDLDGDGRIDDGGELFGARSGDGFAELAAHDEDGNGWIDEGDPVYSRLQLWQPGADGGGELRGLAEADVGAIHLGRIASAFEYRDGDNTPLASLRSTGVYLRDTGGAGTVQQLDLFV